VNVVTRESVLAAFEVDAEKGRLFWKNPTKYHPRVKGAEAGCARKQSRGQLRYWYVKIGGRSFKRAHLVFLACVGRAPRGVVDHINGNSMDDRISNLREATRTENARNHGAYRKTSGLPTGVKKLGDGRFQARITVNKKTLSLGVFSSAEAAAARYQQSKETEFGTFNRVF